MRSINKLTAQTIKRLIKEEKQKIEYEEKKKLLESLRLLKKIKNRQMKNLKESKELNVLKKALLKKINRK